MRIGTWNLAGRWSAHHAGLLLAADCDVWLLTEVNERTTLPGYTLTNFRLSYRPSPMFELLARVNNAFDKRYATYGALAETVFDAQGNYTGAEADALFIAPGTPRSYFVGLRVSF